MYDMKKMLLYLSVFFCVQVLHAQDGSRLEALKIAYLTRRLNLSPQEAQRFWPVYNQYSDELRETRQAAKKNATNELELEEAVLNVRKKYNAEFSKALTPEKVNLFYKSEKEFGNFVKNEMERRQLRQQQKKVLVNP